MCIRCLTPSPTGRPAREFHRSQWPGPGDELREREVKDIPRSYGVRVLNPRLPVGPLECLRPSLGPGNVCRGRNQAEGAVDPFPQAWLRKPMSFDPAVQSLLVWGCRPVFSLRQPQEDWAGGGPGKSQGSPRHSSAAERGSTPHRTCHPASGRTAPRIPLQDTLSQLKPQGVWEPDSPETAGMSIPADFLELAGCPGGGGGGGEDARERTWVQTSSLCLGGGHHALARKQPPGSLAPTSPAPASAIFTVNVKMLP